MWVAPILWPPSRDGRGVTERARRHLRARLVLADACIAGVLVGQMHLSFFARVSSDDRVSDFATASVAAMITTALLATWALRRAGDAGELVVRWSLVASVLNFPFWGAAMLLAALLTSRRPGWSGPMLREVLEITVASLVVTLPLGLLFGGFHRIVLRGASLARAPATLQTLMAARVAGDVALLVASAVGELIARFGNGHAPHAWCIPFEVLALGLGAGDLLWLAVREAQARRTLAQVLAGRSRSMHRHDGTAVPIPADLVPVAALGGQPLMLLAGPVGGGFRESAGREVAALLPASLARDVPQRRRPPPRA